MKNPWPKQCGSLRPEYPAELWAIEYLLSAREALDAVRHAEEDFASATTSARAKTAFRNFLEQSRSVTWALEKLKGTTDEKSEWDQWWSGVTVTLRADPVCQWFYKFRNGVIKAGQSVRLENVRYVQTPMPPNIKGTMWESEWKEGPPDGSWVRVMGIPLEFETRPFTDLMQHHIDVLDNVVSEVMQAFWPKGEVPEWMRVPLFPGDLRYSPPPSELSEVIQEMDRRSPL